MMFINGFEKICQKGTASMRNIAGFTRRKTPAQYCFRNFLDCVAWPSRTSRVIISSSTRALSSAPFYGAPRPTSSRYPSPSDQGDETSSFAYNNLPPLSPLQRLGTFIHSSITAINDPSRADAVAAVGEVTGSFALSRMLYQMKTDEVGQRILRERPLVDGKIIDKLKMAAEAKKGSVDDAQSESSLTLGDKYLNFLQAHGFHPEERDPVRFLSDPDLSYVMTRYRQCHDFWHALTNLPPTVLGELGLKWFELMQTGLPLAALSAISGTFAAGTLQNEEERRILTEVYMPWAVRVGRQAKPLMCVYYEEELGTNLHDLRERLRIEPAPKVDL